MAGPQISPGHFSRCRGSELKSISSFEINQLIRNQSIIFINMTSTVIIDITIIIPIITLQRFQHLKEQLIHRIDVSDIEMALQVFKFAMNSPEFQWTQWSQGG